MPEGLPLEWEVFKTAVDDLAACSSYGTCHPIFAFTSRPDDILCRRSDDGSRDATHKEDCFDLLKAILYVEHSGFRGEKTLKCAARLPGGSAIALRALGWRVNYNPIGPSDYVGNVQFSPGDGSKAELRSGPLLEVVLGP